MSTKPTHLTQHQRSVIEALLGEQNSLRHIADRIAKVPSTVSREVRNHTKVVVPKCCDCVYASHCKKKQVCGSTSCNRQCKTCSKAKRHCPDYVQAVCDLQPERVCGLCNGCSKRGYCHYTKRFYNAVDAELEYRDKLVSSRNGFDLTGEQFMLINGIVSPAIHKGQSVYHVLKTHKDELPVSESTVRRLIKECELDVRDIDLPEAVRRKPRRHKNDKPLKPAASKAGHLYSDYLSYVADNDVNIIEMDCVEGTQDDKEAILTLHLTAFKMQLYYVLEEHTSACVVAMLDAVEEALGKELFASVFQLILTDNGHEFTDIEGMERSIYGGTRTKVFFCEPNRSDEKGRCENNHKLFRRIIPKGTSISSLMQPDMVLITNHINSYSRRSLFGKSPFEAAEGILPEDFFVSLGLEKIPGDQVMLSPDLLRRG